MLLRILVIVSLLLSATGLAVLSFLLFAPRPEPGPVAEAPPPPPPPARIRVVTAARALPVGTLLKDEDFATRDLPAGELPERAIVLTEESRAELRGALLRRYLDAGALVERADVLRPRDRGFLAAVLRPSMRAISVAVDVVTGAAGLIWPGDQVDLILTQELSSTDAPLALRVIGETLLTDIRVIAVDQQFTRGANAADSVPGRVARTVTLEVNAEQAERVAVAARLGRIALTIRAMDGREPEIAPSGTPLFGADVSPALVRSALPQGARMRVIHGDEEHRDITFR